MVRGAARAAPYVASVAFLLSLSNQERSSMETSKQSIGTDYTSTQWLDDIKKLTEKFQ